MAFETLFSDHVINASELRTNQKRWLEEALKLPVTLNYGKGLLAIVNRDLVRDLFLHVRYAELALLACQDADKGRIIEELPWLDYLSEEERMQFRNELLSCFMKSRKAGNWNELADLIADWKATAETERHPEVVEALKDTGASSEYDTLQE